MEKFSKFDIYYLPIVKAIPSNIFVRIHYLISCKRILHLKNPCTFNEKVQWSKLYDHNPLYTSLVDKYEVKGYVEEKIGCKYIIPTLGVWDNVDDIDVNNLPQQFVLKCTHDSGSVIICDDKNNFDFENSLKKLKRALERNYYYQGREWVYKNVKPRVIAEKYMVEKGKDDLPDYKFFCFDGKVFCSYTMLDYTMDHSKGRLGFFDREYNLMPYYRDEYAPISEQLSPPENYDKMVEIAETLSRGFSHVRVDLYNISGKIYFGEMTFTTSAGYGKFSHPEFDMILGEQWKLDVSNPQSFNL